MRQKDSARGFSLIEVLVVAGLIVIIAAISLPRLLRSRAVAGDASAVNTLRILSNAQLSYSSTFGQGFSTDLDSLGPPPAGEAPSPAGADLVDGLMAGRFSGDPNRFTRSGYLFVYTAGSASPPVMEYTISGDPVARGTSGIKSYFIDHTGIVRVNPDGTATAADPPLR
jgi:prepilin-type N-terminal cleavage/methylation domain-containing protein